MPARWPTAMPPRWPRWPPIWPIGGCILRPPMRPPKRSALSCPGRPIKYWLVADGGYDDGVPAAPGSWGWGSLVPRLPAGPGVPAAADPVPEAAHHQRAPGLGLRLVRAALDRRAPQR